MLSLSQLLVQAPEDLYVVTGSEKSSPGGDTASMIVTEPSLLGEPIHLTLPDLS